MSGMRDEYGNPVRQTDEYGNSVRETHGGTMGSYGTTGIDPTSGYGNRGTGTDGRVGGFGGGGHGAGHAGGGHMQEHRVGGGGTGLGGMLQRSGSSSSSDDDGQGGRRKKGMAQKIKDKISGVGGKERDPRHTGTRGQNTTYGPSHEDQYYGQEGYEKKGTMEKIKEKIPGVGGKQKDPHHAHTNQPMGQETTYGQHNQQYYGTESHEKKGIMEKIKEGVAGKEKDPRHTPNKTLVHQPMGQQATHGQHHEEYYGQEGREKKGIMEKIKEKIPGGGHSRDV